MNKEQEEDTIYIPPYHIAKVLIGYGNGKARVTTSTYQIRCNPDHAQFFKCIFCRMAITKAYPLSFFPEGAILTDGPEKYRSILKGQNE